MKYPVVLHQDQDSDFGVTVPDLPGCFSAGGTVELALEAVVEAIECHVEGLLVDGESIPQVTPVAIHRKNKDYARGLWALVEVDLSKVSGKAKRVNITLPENLLNQIDSFAARIGESRSGFLAHAAMQFVSAHQAAGKSINARSSLSPEAAKARTKRQRRSALHA